MAVYLLRLFGATLAAMTTALLITYTILWATAPRTISPTHAANIALAQAFADEAPMLIPVLAQLLGLFVFLGLLAGVAICTSAAVSRWQQRKPMTPTGGEEK